MSGETSNNIGATQLSLLTQITYIDSVNVIDIIDDIQANMVDQE
jgi:hypothetical protein